MFLSLIYLRINWKIQFFKKIGGTRVPSSTILKITFLGLYQKCLWKKSYGQCAKSKFFIFFVHLFMKNDIQVFFCCCCLCLFRVLDENFCNFEMRQLFFFFLFQQQCKYGKVSFSLGCYFFAIITWGTAQDWRSFCLNYFAAVVERKCIFPIGKRRRDLLITQSNFKRPLALLGWKW